MFPTSSPFSLARAALGAAGVVEMAARVRPLQSRAEVVARALNGRSAAADLGLKTPRLLMLPASSPLSLAGATLGATWAVEMAARTHPGAASRSKWLLELEVAARARSALPRRGRCARLLRSKCPLKECYLLFVCYRHHLFLG